MATYGEIRFRLSKLARAQGVDLDLLDGWIQDRYLEILDALPWQRLEKQATLQTTAEYDTGTCDVTNGSTSITGTGTTWTTGMTGRLMRINNEETFYLFTGFTTPGTVYHHDMETGLSTVFREPQLRFAPDEYVTEQVFYRSKDGT